jgi:hypothetical protein
MTVEILGSGVLGTSLLAESLTPSSPSYASVQPTTPARIIGGSIIIDQALYRANRDNRQFENLNEYTYEGSLTLDTTQETIGSFTFKCDPPNILTPYRDWVAPKMSLTTPDHRGQGSVTTTGQIGLFFVLPPSEEWTAISGSESIQCGDSLAMMQLALIDRTYKIDAGANVASTIKSLINSLGLRAIVQSSSETQNKKRTWDIGTSKLTIANDLARSIGFVPLFIDRFGRIHTRKFRKMSQQEPYVTISSRDGDIYDSVTLDPDIERLCNHVVVVGNSPKDVKLKKIITNKDRSSPVSIYSLGDGADNPTYISKFEENTKLDKQSAVDARAQLLIDRGSSVMERMTITTNPFLYWTLNETVQVDIETDDGTGVASGEWRVERMEYSFGVEAKTTWTLAKLQRWSEIND